MCPDEGGVMSFCASCSTFVTTVTPKCVDNWAGTKCVGMLEDEPEETAICR
jgi:hypothetical protein